MASSSDQINYAHIAGIKSVAAAAIFAALYAVLLPYYIWRAIRNPLYVLILLSLFCASKPVKHLFHQRAYETDCSPLVRVTAFILRAVLAGSDSAGQDVGLLIGETIVYSVGFFGLLYSAYNLVLDRYVTLLWSLCPRI